MTGEADRLANAGLIVRRPDPADRRAVLVNLTPAGRMVAESALQAYLDASEEALDVLSETERDTLAELLRKLLVGLEGAVPKTAPAEDAAGKPPRPKDSRPKQRFQSESA
jgi:hypothetical protein